MIIGLFLILFGAFWLLESIGIIDVNVGQFVWPAILIAIGTQILWDGIRKRNCCKPMDKKNK